MHRSLLLLSLSLSALYGQLGILVCVESEMNWSESTNSPTPPLSPPCLPGQGRELTGSITVARQRSVTSAHLHLPESLQLLSDETVIPRHVRSVPIKPSVVTLSPCAVHASFFFFFFFGSIDWFFFFLSFLPLDLQTEGEPFCLLQQHVWLRARQRCWIKSVKTQIQTSASLHGQRDDFWRIERRGVMRWRSVTAPRSQSHVTRWSFLLLWTMGSVTLVLHV